MTDRKWVAIQDPGGQLLKVEDFYTDGKLDNKKIIEYCEKHNCDVMFMRNLNEVTDFIVRE
jgi:hypothetical protein